MRVELLLLFCEFTFGNAGVDKYFWCAKLIRLCVRRIGYGCCENEWCDSFGWLCKGPNCWCWSVIICWCCCCCCKLWSFWRCLRCAEWAVNCSWANAKLAAVAEAWLSSLTISTSRIESVDDARDAVSASAPHKDVGETGNELAGANWIEFVDKEDDDCSQHQPIDMVDLGNLVRHNIRNVHASTGCRRPAFGCCCCWCCCCRCRCCCWLLLLLLLLRKFEFELLRPALNWALVGRVKISAFKISGPLIQSAYFANTRNAGSTVRVDEKLSLMPLRELEPRNSLSHSSKLMSLTPVGCFAIIGTGYLLISASEISAPIITLFDNRAAVSSRLLFVSCLQVSFDPSEFSSGK